MMGYEMSVVVRHVGF